MGSAIAWDLARSGDVDELRVSDISEARLSDLRGRLGDRVSTQKIDVTDPARITRFLRGMDAAVSALPHGAVHPADVAAMLAGAKLVNIAFEDEQMKLDRRAKEHRAVLVPGCGVAPGLSNILVAEGTRGMTEAEGHIYVGGLPQKPEPPLSYRLVFSVRGLIREYVSARVVRDGRVVGVRPFSEVERQRFEPPIGMLEAFVTDGLGSSIYTLNHLKQLDERTLRYPGHAEKIKFLLEAGFFDDRKIRLPEGAVAPVDISEHVLRTLLTKGDPRDVTVMRVKTTGWRDGRRVSTTFELVDHYNEKNEISSMGRTTGFTAAIVARMLGRGEIDGIGVLPPETCLGQHGTSRLLSQLSDKGVAVRRRTTSS